MSAQTTTQAMIKGGSPTIFVTDMARAVSFYTDILGLRLQYRAGDHFAMIDAGDGLTLGLHLPSESAAAPGTPGSIQVGLNVCQPLAQVVETLQSRGVRFQQHGQDPVVDDGAVKLAFFSDPDGTTQGGARQASHGARLTLSRSACPAVSPAMSRRARCGIRP